MEKTPDNNTDDLLSVDKSTPVTAVATSDKYANVGKFSTKRTAFSVFWFLLCLFYALVMLTTGFNFLPLIAAALAAASAVFVLFDTLRNRSVNPLTWWAYALLLASTFLFFVIWSAEPFGKRLWWNLVLVAAPMLAAVALLFLKKAFSGKTLKLLSLAVVFIMAGTSIVYLLFMNLRTRPTVESLAEGHDAYLNSVSTAKPDSPNILVILMDDMGYADISAYSYLYGKTPTINTPNIDSIAVNGIMMDNFYSSSPVCSPSRFSILTGRYSSRGYLDNVVFPTTVESTPWSPSHFYNPFQFPNNVDGILGDEITFAEVLQRMGYDTACIGKWNLGDYGQYLPTNQGFDYFYGSYYVNDMTPYNWVRDTGAGHPEGETHAEVRTHADNLDQSESTRLFTAEILDFIDESVQNGNKFLAYYTTPWPHYPIFSDNNGNGKGDTSDDTYIDCIEEFDRGVGEILDYLRSTGLYDDTLIIFTSDNGPGREGATGALRGRKNTTFEGGMKVPLIVSYPGGGVGSGTAIEDSSFVYYPYGTDGTPVTATTKRIVSSSMNFDLFTTILSLCGVNSLPSDRIIDGKDLSALWRAEVPSDTRVHEMLFYQKGGKAQAVQMATELDGTVYDFKYYDRVQTENSAFFNQYYVDYLFNLDLDPIEGYNITPRYPEIAAKLSAALDAFRAETKTNRRGIIR